MIDIFEFISTILFIRTNILTFNPYGGRIAIFQSEILAFLQFFYLLACHNRIYYVAPKGYGLILNLLVSE
nr:MAG TPA: hypothetical protein [Caudoviricetes sp.]